MTANTNMLGKQGNGGNKKPPPPMSEKTKGTSVLAYFLLPGVIPLIKELGRGGFGYLAFLIAIVYQAVRILPANHPYTKVDNIGKFGLRKVIAAAANNIKLDRKNIDQVIIFFAILTGMLIMVLQLVSIVFVMFSGEAWAQEAINTESFGGIFKTQHPDTDIAFHMIREVFGLPEMFGEIKDGQTGFHKALQTMFQFYNLAILVVAVLVFLYYVIVVVAETAQSGTPFGKRFSHVYAPFRLVAAIGLLVPLNYGFNGSQYITFFAAKTGSGFATTGWTQFNKTLEDGSLTPSGAKSASLIAEPNMPDVTGLVEAMSVMVACKEAYLAMEGKEIKAYFIDSKGKPLEIDEKTYGTITKQQKDTGKKEDIPIIFGVDVANIGIAGKGVVPYCGKIIIPNNVTDITPIKAVGNASPEKIQEHYFNIVLSLWKSPTLQFIGERIAWAHHTQKKPCGAKAPTAGIPGGPGGGGRLLFPSDNCAISYKPPASAKERISSDVKSVIEFNIKSVFKAIRKNAEFKLDEDILRRGWGGAGIWYNKIAQVNGAYTQATLNIPNVKIFPIVMENVKDEKSKSDGSFKGCKAYVPNLKDNKEYRAANGNKDIYYAAVLNETFQYWRCDRKASAANFFWDSIGAIFGLNGLFNIRQEIKETSADGKTITTQIHPLAKLSAVGAGLINSAIRNMGFAMAASFGGGMAGILLSHHFNAAGQAASGMFVSIATIGLSIGFILYYILPFLPFMYFFFAVGSWVKSIFEAMVGAPLWALAHLRIDGDGFSGKMAVNGYILILEIFLRPILTVFGLLGGMAVFTAMAAILNEIFDLVVSNVTNSNFTEDQKKENFGRHLIDGFFFTVVYAVLLYMMAISSFKMVNLVPNNILRWLGQSVSSFSDQAQDATQGLVQYAAMGGARIGGQLAGGMTKLGEAAGSGIAAPFGLLGGKQGKQGN